MPAVTSTTVPTPRGTQVPVRVNPDNTLDPLYKQLLRDQERQYINRGADRIAGPTDQYNCHSYAWYLQSTGNTYFMDDPSAFWTDGSYVRVTSAAPSAAIPAAVPNGARAVWMSSAGTPVHSGVVAFPLTAETRRVFLSKWDVGSLMRHAPGNSKYDGTSVRIDYYVRNTNPATPSPPPPPTIPANGIVRTPEGTIWVLAGGAKYAMSWPEYVGIGTPPYTSLPASAIAGYGSMPRTNTFLRNPSTGSIYQVVDGAKYGLSMVEYQALGTPAYVNVPQGFIDRVSGTVPPGPIFLRNPVNGSIFQVLSGAKYGLTMVEYQALGTPAYVNVPQGFIDRATAVAPKGTWFLRDTTQTIYQVVGGAKFALAYPEWAALGYPGYVSVPTGFTARITATVPAGTVYLRDDAGNIFRVTRGAKTYLSLDAWAGLGYPAYVQVPTRWLDGIPAATTSS